MRDEEIAMRSTVLFSATVAALVSMPLLASADSLTYEEGGPIPHYSANPPVAATQAAQDKAYEEGGPIRSYGSAAMPAAAQQASGDYLASAMIGDAVKDRSGRQIGEVQDLVMSSDGRVDGVVLAVDNSLGFGSKRVGVDVRDFQPAGNKTLVTSITPQQLSAATDFSQQPTLLH